jgi:hypothetical protein
MEVCRIISDSVMLPDRNNRIVEESPYIISLVDFQAAHSSYLFLTLPIRHHEPGRTFTAH